MQLEDIVEELMSIIDSCGGNGVGNEACELGELATKTVMALKLRAVGGRGPMKSKATTSQY